MTDLTDPLDGEVQSFSGPDAHITGFMSDDYATVAPTTTLRQATVALEDSGHGIMIVGSADAVEGVVSERDVLRAIAHDVDLDTTTVAEIESKHLKWAMPDSRVGEVVAEMMEGYIRHVLVGDAGRLVGVVSMRDLLAAYLD